VAVRIVAAEDAMCPLPACGKPARTKATFTRHLREVHGMKDPAVAASLWREAHVTGGPAGADTTGAEPAGTPLQPREDLAEALRALVTRAAELQAENEQLRAENARLHEVARRAGALLAQLQG
jgi:hypothetical protein